MSGDRAIIGNLRIPFEFPELPWRKLLIPYGIENYANIFFSLG
jgi:hypothetical protein